MRCLQVGLLLVLTAWARANPGYVGAPIAVASVPAVSVSSQYHAQDTLGQYSYGYSGGPSAKAETKTADGVTRGSYSYVDAHGLVQTANYVSDPVNGFRVAATNLAHDTPEVAAAKAAHFAAYVEAAAAAEANPDIPEPVEHVAVESAPLVYTGSAPVAYTGSAPVAYTGSAPVAVSSVPAVYSGSHGFAYSTSSVAPTYAPHFYSSVLPPSVITYTAPGIVSSADSNGGFSYSATSVAPTYAPHYYSAVLPTSTFPILPSGVPADTPEVAAAKAAHYAAHFTEKLRHLYHGHYYY